MRTGGRPRFGVFESFWGIGGVPGLLANPNDAIFVVAMNENDDGDPQLVRGLVDAAVNASLVESVALARPGLSGTLTAKNVAIEFQPLQRKEADDGHS